MPLAAAPGQDGTDGTGQTNAAGLSLVQRSLGSLALLLPRKIQKPEGGYRTDWSLTVLASALFMFLLATVRLRLMRLSDIG